MMPESFSSSLGLPAGMFSSASLFLLINLVIGTIFIRSRFTSNRKPHEKEELRPSLVRAPSLLDRVKSINLSFRKNLPSNSDMTPDSLQNEYSTGVDHPPALERTPSLLQRLKSVNFSSYRSEPKLGDDSEPEAELTGECESEPEPEVLHHQVKRSKSEQPHEKEELRPSLVRAPSLLDRVKSINLSFRKNLPSNSDMPPDSLQNEYSPGVDHPPALERTPSLLQRLKSVNSSSLYRSEPKLGDDSEPEAEFAGEFESEPEPEVLHHQVKRSRSEQPGAPERKDMETKMKKWASVKAVRLEAETEEAEERERRRPQTARLEKRTSFGDEGVDAKADDFINKFKQQLKLQRLDSLLRYGDRLRGN